MASSRKVSSLRPLAWRWWLPAAAVGLVMGEVAAQAAGSWAVPAAIAAILTTPAIALGHRARGTAAMIGAAAAALGVVLSARAIAAEAASLRSLSFVGHYRIVGVIEAVSERQARDGVRWARLEVRIERVRPRSTGLEMGQRVSLSLWRVARHWRPGERVRFATPFRRPRGWCNLGADRYAQALVRARVAAVGRLSDDRWLERMRRGRPLGLAVAIARARDATAAAIAEALSPVPASVLDALVVGDQGKIPEQLRDAFARTGTSHVLSVSGLHIAIVAGSAYQVLRRVLAALPWTTRHIAPMRIAAAVALLPAVAYAAFAGAAVATVRSLIMAAMFLAGTALLQPADLLVGLAAAALVICGQDPTAPFDPSFQLSFGAVAAIVVGMKRLEASRLGGMLHAPAGSGIGARLRAATASAVAVSVVAGLGTAPLTAAHFGTISLAGLLANVIVVPLVGGLALLAGLAGTALVPASDIAAQACFVAAGWFIEGGSFLVQRAALLPGAGLDVTAPSAGETAAWLLAVASLARRGARARTQGVALGSALAVIIGAYASLGVSGVRISFLDVGQGDAALVELARAGPVLVVDGGGGAVGADVGTRVLVPALRVRRARDIRAVAMSHAQVDHYGGLGALVRRFPPRELWWTGRGTANDGFIALQREIAASGARWRRLATGGSAPLDGLPVRVEVLYPPADLVARSANEASLVLGVRYGATRFLFAGDIEAQAERALLARGADLTASVLKVPHHGSRSSSTEGFVHAVRPAVTVAGIGAGNRFAFPAREVVARYVRAGAVWLGTDQAGEVVVESDGQLSRIATCRSLEP